MTSQRLEEILSRYPRLKIGICGDFCLDRYFDIDPEQSEISIETGLTVHNIFRTRCQAGAAGTILNNLVDLGIGELYPIGIRGEDGEGYELDKALRKLRGVSLDYFLTSPQRKTFTYTKPLLHRPDRAPEELNRLDIKNWTPTPEELRQRVDEALRRIIPKLDGLIFMDQVDVTDTGVVTTTTLKTLESLLTDFPNLPILVDSRRGLASFPPAIFKMNAHEASTFFAPSRDGDSEATLDRLKELGTAIAKQNQRPVFITLAQNGILGVGPEGDFFHQTAYPVQGEIDIVGAGDSVTANLTAALAAGGSMGEAIELANAAASIVIHQLGTTGTASTRQLRAKLQSDS